MRMARPIILCTGNKNKLKELLNILGPGYKNKIECQDLDLPEYQGEPEEIAMAKCKLAAEHFKAPVIVEDVSLCFNALGGMPGPYIKWFLKKLGAAGLPKLLAGFEDKTAYAQCIVAYSSGEKDTKIQIFDGRCPGKIVEPRGSTEFGWDPVFQPDGYAQTYAEMTPDIKNAISHRSKAVLGLKEYFLKIKQ